MKVGWKKAIWKKKHFPELLIWGLARTSFPALSLVRVLLEGRPCIYQVCTNLRLLGLEGLPDTHMSTQTSARCSILHVHFTNVHLDTYLRPYISTSVNTYLSTYLNTCPIM